MWLYLKGKVKKKKSHLMGRLTYDLQITRVPGGVAGRQRERECVCVCVRVCVRARMCTWGACMPAQLCPTLYNPVDYSPPGISVHGIS